LGLTFIVPETTTKAAPDQSKTNSTEEEPKGKKEEDLSTEEREENPARRKRIFKPANKIQFHSAADRVEPSSPPWPASSIRRSPLGPPGASGRVLAGPRPSPSRMTPPKSTGWKQ
jgi:hypothetical protein